MDRNPDGSVCLKLLATSLSVRRAWIEIIMQTKIVIGCVVALRKESVDRNANVDCEALGRLVSLSVRRAWIEISLPWANLPQYIQSLSVRRAWIEIAISQKWTKRTTVALRKESVDRNKL